MTTTTLAAPTAFIRHRVAVSIMFLMNGLLVGGWAPAIPVFKDNHALAESQLGLMILLIGIGSLLTGAIIAWVAADNRRAVKIGLSAKPQRLWRNTDTGGAASKGNGLSSSQ